MSQDLHLIIREPVEQSCSPEQPKREYWTVSKTWSTDLSEARLYKDRATTMDVRRDLAKGGRHFIQRNSFVIPTRFSVLSENEARIQHDCPVVIPRSIGLQGTYYKERLRVRKY